MSPWRWVFDLAILLATVLNTMSIFAINRSLRDLDHRISQVTQACQRAGVR